MHSRLRTAAALVFALLLLAPGSGKAQAVLEPEVAPSPEAFACAFFHLLDSDRWAEAARLYDEPALGEWLRSTIRRHASTADVRIPSVEEYLESNPGMPPEVAAYQLERARSHFGGAFIRRWIAVDSVEELRDLAPREAAARALEAYDPVYQRDVALDDPGVSRGWKERVANARVRERTRRIVGTLALADRAFVAYRPLGGPMSPDPRHGPPSLLALVRRGKSGGPSPAGTTVSWTSRTATPPCSHPRSTARTPPPTTIRPAPPAEHRRSARPRRAPSGTPVDSWSTSIGRNGTRWRGTSRRTPSRRGWPPSWK